MTNPGSASLHSTAQRPCRVARSPALLLCIALVYALATLVYRDADKGSGRSGVRGGTSSSSDDSEDRRGREAAAAWEPENEDNSPRFSYETARGPVKGGVEVYPVQPARRPRKVRPPLVPEVAIIEQVLTAWVMPKVYYDGGGEAIKGLYIMFHGCNHGPLDWFDLPEERTIVDFLVRMGYAVVAPGSRDMISGCWTYNTGSGDITPVKAMLWRWYRDWSIPPNTPLFLFGASSGGNMATMLGSHGGFQLCDKRTTYVRVSGVISQVSWGVDPGNYGANCPPLAFMPMPKGEPLDVSDAADKTPSVFGNSRKIPPRITAIAHNVRKSGGRPRMLLLPLGELSLYKSFFSDRVYEISEAQSARLHGALLASHMMECDPSRFAGGEMECFLTKDPRTTPLALETLVATYEVTVQRTADTSPTVKGSANEELGQDDLSKNSAHPEDQAMSLPLLQPSMEDYRKDASSKEEASSDAVPAGPRPMTKSHATKVLRELLNVAWGAHELSADFVALWEPWLWDSCGDNCRPGPWRQ